MEKDYFKDIEDYLNEKQETEADRPRRRGRRPKNTFNPDDPDYGVHTAFGRRLLNKKVYDKPEFSSPVAYTLSARNFLYRNYHSHLPNYDGVNLRSISTVYLKSRTAEEIVHNTLAGYLVKLLEKNEGMSEDCIRYYMDTNDDYQKLRRFNGTPYTSDPVRAIRGGLHSNGLFRREEGNIWRLKQPEAKLYINAEISKISRIKKKIEGKMQDNFSCKNDSDIIQDEILEYDDKDFFNNPIIPHGKDYEGETSGFNPFEPAKSPSETLVVKWYNLFNSFLFKIDITKIENDSIKVFLPSLINCPVTSSYLAKRYKEDQAFAGCIIIYSLFRDQCLLALDSEPKIRFENLKKIGDVIDKLLFNFNYF